MELARILLVLNADKCQISALAMCTIWRVNMASEINMLNLLESGLKAEGLRQKAIANNVANLETPGFRRSDVRFEDILNDALNSGGTKSPELVEAELYQPKNTAVNANNNDVSLDHEVGEMVKNNLRHKTMALILKKKYRQIDAAINIR